MACHFEEGDLCLRQQGRVYLVPAEDGGEGVFVVAAGGAGGRGRGGPLVGRVCVVLTCVDVGCWGGEVELCGRGRGVVL